MHDGAHCQDLETTSKLKGLIGSEKMAWHSRPILSSDWQTCILGSPALRPLALFAT
jgi:hypothetical protein